MRRSLELARADPTTTGVRLRLASGALRARFASEPEPGDEVVETEGVRLFVAPGVLADGDVEIDVTDEHEQLMVRPLESDA